MGRYTSRDSSYDSSYDGYSRHSKDEMVEHLKEMMRNANTEEERDVYRKTIEQLQRYCYTDVALNLLIGFCHFFRK